MTKIINITKCYQPLKIESYIVAAWQFALLALWPFEEINNNKVKRCQSYIKSYLQSIPETQASFITFCERILLIKRTLSASPPNIIDPPALWLNPDFTSGYAATDELHRLIKKNRVKPPHYIEGITVLAKGYWDFINQPTTLELSKIHDRLYNLRQYDLISLLSYVSLKYILVAKQLI
jgi:hypothetical protein